MQRAILARARSGGKWELGALEPWGRGARGRARTKPECALKSTDKTFKLPSPILHRGFRDLGDFGGVEPLDGREINRR